MTPDMIASTPVQERLEVCKMLRRHKVSLPLASQVKLLSCEATVAREAAEHSKDWSVLISMMQPWGGPDDSCDAYDPSNPRAADIQGPDAQTKWSWFQRMIIDECLVEYVVKGEEAHHSTVALAKQLVTCLEAALDDLTDEFFVKKVDATLSVARTIEPMTKPDVDDITRLHSEALALKQARQSRGTSVRVCVATAIFASPWWTDKLEKFVDANAAAMRYVEEIEEFTATLDKFEATGADVVASHMDIMQAQSQKLCFYQTELLEGTVVAFEQSLLTSARRVFDFVEKAWADKVLEAPNLTWKLSHTLAELSNCFPQEAMVNTMVDKVAEVLASTSASEATEMMKVALEGLRDAKVPTEGKLMESKCAEFAAAYKAWVKQPHANVEEEMTALMGITYIHVVSYLLFVMDADRLEALMQAGASLHALLEETGNANGEIAVIGAVLSMNAKLADFDGKEVSTIFGEATSFEKGVEMVREFQQVQQHLLTTIRKAKKGLKEVIDKGSEAATLADAQMDKFQQYLVSVLSDSLTAACDEVKRVASLSDGGAAWHDGLGARAAWPKVQEQGAKYFADFDEQGVSGKVAVLEKDSREVGYPTWFIGQDRF